jgi:hypothetical protein
MIKVTVYFKVSRSNVTSSNPYPLHLDEGLAGWLLGGVPVPLVGLVVIGVILGLGHCAQIKGLPRQRDKENNVNFDNIIAKIQIKMVY